VFDGGARVAARWRLGFVGSTAAVMGGGHIGQRRAARHPALIPDVTILGESIRITRSSPQRQHTGGPGQRGCAGDGDDWRERRRQQDS
jgi:hypothetical protein